MRCAIQGDGTFCESLGQVEWILSPFWHRRDGATSLRPKTEAKIRGKEKGGDFVFLFTGYEPKRDGAVPCARWRRPTSRRSYRGH